MRRVVWGQWQSAKSMEVQIQPHFTGSSIPHGPVGNPLPAPWSQVGGVSITHGTGIPLEESSSKNPPWSCVYHNAIESGVVGFWRDSPLFMSLGRRWTSPASSYWSTGAIQR